MRAEGTKESPTTHSSSRTMLSALICGLVLYSKLILVCAYYARCTSARGMRLLFLVRFLGL